MKSDNVIVCFLDVLGYQQLVDGKSPEEVYNNFLKAVSLKDIMERKYKEGSTVSKNINMQILSDSIIFTIDLDNISDFHESFKLLDKKGFATDYFFYFIISFYIYFVINVKYLLRGGIAKGQYYQEKLDKPENQFIFSKAQVEAFRLENVAYFPRVVVSDILCKQISEDTNISDMIKESIIKDRDGLYYLDIYRFFLIKKFNEKLRKELLSSICEVIKSKLKKHKGNFKIMQKYEWFLNYHNDKIMEMRDSFGLQNYKDFIINGEAYLSL